MHVATELSRLLGPLRRALLRRTRDAAGLPDLPEAQIQLLRVLEGGRAVGMREVADRLQLAPSTISNLVRTMTGHGLVERRTSDTDLRSAELVATERALGLLRRYDEVSDAALQDALGELSASDRNAVANAIPALQRLLQSLER